MEVLDVLIIGGGPHALTLASLLSQPPPARTEPPEPPGNHLENSDKGRHVSKKKRRRRRGTADVTLEEQLGRSTLEERPPGPAPRPPPLSMRVLDSYGVWASLWESQFAALNIPHLRSHTLVHTDPHNKKALQEFVVERRRCSELHSLPDQMYILDENAFFNDTRLGKKEKKRLKVASSLGKSLSFSLPGTALSVDFFQEQVERYRLERLLLRGTAARISPVMEDEQEGSGTPKTVKHFLVRLGDGGALRARRVVMATGPTRAQMANVPSWVSGIDESYPEERLRHTVQLMHRLAQRNAQTGGEGVCAVCEPSQRVMVVGGGLTSAHMVSMALQQGAASVTWVMRKHLQLKQFDVGDVESLVGRYAHVEHGVKMDGRAYLRQFYNERSLHKRLAMIRLARKGGAVTPEAYVHLQPHIASGRVDVKTYCQVSKASWCYRSQAWSVSLSTGHHWAGDVIWLATGCKLDATQDPLLAEVMREFPIQVIDGWPCVSESLRWAQGCPLYLMGQYAALQVGPHAVNLAGGQAASARIARDLWSYQDPDGGGAKVTTEEYIQQMQGLLWL